MNDDYEQAGFDGFLSRSIDDVQQTNLESTGPISTQVRFDASQISGSLGDQLTIGNIKLDGVKGRISVYDDSNNEVIRIGELDD